MNLDVANPIADAVLYEGHILYPYRPSARKNRVRWTFGGVHPRAYSEASGGLEPCYMQVQCLFEPTDGARLAVRVRFLHLIHRQVLKLSKPAADLGSGALPPAEPVDAVQVAGRLHQTWDEAEERCVETELPVSELLGGGPRRLPIDFAGRVAREALQDETGAVVAVLERRQASIAGEIEIGAEGVGAGLVRLTVRVTNETSLHGLGLERDGVMRSSFVSTHAVIGIDGGAFISLADPPEEFAALARACEHQGAWPVMVGSEGDSDVVLATPIILEDYPQIAPESETALFDSTEIDEILLLRIMTMTDEEKSEARFADPSVAALLDRADSMTEDDLMRMHGTTRSLRPSPDLD